MQNLSNIIIWHTDQLGLAQPYSTIFDDVYYSSDNGMQETDYVFLKGNQLAQRWQQLLSANFTIIETGFGTGLNFLCAAQLWLESTPKEATLHFISTEKYPLTLQDITKALLTWPTLSHVYEEFLAQYETALEQSILLFNERIRLTILIGDATDSLSELNITADAWFLDGFSPAKNPDMWESAVFTQMARLSKTETTFATFTSAGLIKRGLQAAGFHVNKQKGFGKKREMLLGNFSGNASNVLTPPIPHD